ncbi:hypothetical protein [Anaeromyxobacter oryzae]|uniref:Transmembrane protein n=1 Tax=Anaeromyxobacter oryzae TaxID=2918170 RepID=A0ABM7X453_9BACT|nr:hypothetical protein [Anaeromyxobacter oryzae]BDG06596.1 hypothetical protein AMOR_55920 [Anaeromyxobacter oryzae]
MSTAPQPTAADPVALRAEHDVLAKQLETRRSIDVARRGLYLVFAGLIGTGTSIALAWDRWGRLKPGVVRKVTGQRPLFLYLAMVVTVVLLALAVRALARARRLMREEDALFSRYRAIREVLRLDP